MDIICEISAGTEGAINKEVVILSPIKSTGVLLDLGIFLVMSCATLVQNLMKILAVLTRSDVMSPLESLILRITFTGADSHWCLRCLSTSQIFKCLLSLGGEAQEFLITKDLFHEMVDFFEKNKDFN